MIVLFLEDKKILRRILDDPKASHRALIEATRTDAELNASLLKIGVEGCMFVKHHYAIQSEPEQDRVLRLGSKSSTSAATEERRANNNAHLLESTISCNTYRFRTPDNL
jgi:hypothetical protein